MLLSGSPGNLHPILKTTFSFLEGLPLSYLHVFTFSERPDTVAEKLPDKVSSAEKTQRSKRLITLSEKKALEFNRKNIGQTTKVLFEKSPAEGLITGFSSNYIKVEYIWQSRLAGQVKRVKFNNISPSGRMRVELIE